MFKVFLMNCLTPILGLNNDKFHASNKSYDGEKMMIFNAKIEFLPFGYVIIGVSILSELKLRN